MRPPSRRASTARCSPDGLEFKQRHERNENSIQFGPGFPSSRFKGSLTGGHASSPSRREGTAAATYTVTKTADSGSGTLRAAIDLADANTLSFSPVSPFALSLPTSALNFSLEQATDLIPPVIWQTVSNGIATNRGNNVFLITNNPTSPTLFFRLRRS
jgi:hypothetical protein